ncbi:MAG: peptidase [Synergistetes bacterium]|nr:peptidase [Synergistota bacterium]
MFDRTREFLKKLGLPGSDAWDLPTSTLRFPDGAHFRIEVPTVNSVEALRALLERAKELGVTINRVDDTYGMMRYSAKEIKEYVAVCKDNGVELNMAVGPRATYDTSATMLTPQGVRIGYRLRGAEQVVRAIEDVLRGVELGVRGILVYDEGLLWVLNEMKKAGELPQNVKFKISAHCGHGNPASFKLLEQLGADSINPVRDMQLPMIAALRQAVKVPIDVHVDNPPASGGFIRVYEAPEMVRIGAPIHLKTGNSVVSAHGIRTTAQNGRDMAYQAALTVEFVKRYYPEAVQSEPGQPDMAIPE